MSGFAEVQREEDNFPVERPTEETGLALIVTHGEITPTSLNIKQGTTFVEWESVKDPLDSLGNADKWWKADWFNEGIRLFSLDGAVQALDPDDETEIETYRFLAWVSEKVPAYNRRVELTFSHHAKVAHVDDVREQAVWLQAAIDNKWSVRELNRKVKGLPEPEDNTTPERPIFQGHFSAEANGQIILDIDPEDWATFKELQEEGFTRPLLELDF
jgi:hypothetical protein